MSRRLLQPDDLGALAANAPELAQVFVSLASDIAWVLDEHGVVAHVAQDPDTPMVAAAEHWIGQPWLDTVTQETRVKVQRMLADLSSTGLARRREVNHLGTSNRSVAVAYTALRLGQAGPALVVGRDLRTVSSMQQHVVRAQLEAERGYWRARHTETRHRLMLQVATDGVLAADAQTLLLDEGNPAAELMLQGSHWPLAGRPLLQQFDAQSRPAVQAVIEEALSTGQGPEVTARLAGNHSSVSLTALRLPLVGPRPLEAQTPTRLLLRARPTEPVVTDALPLEAALARLVDSTRDGILVTDSQGHVLGANRAFVRLAQADDEDGIRGRPLAQWLGQIESDVAALVEAVRERGVVRGIRLDIQGSDGHSPAVTVSVTGMLLVQPEQVCLGFIMRPQAPQAADAPLAGPLGLVQAMEGLAAQIGRSPLDALLQEAERLTRQHLVGRALAIAGNDAAAAMLLNVPIEQLLTWKADLQLDPAATAGSAPGPAPGTEASQPPAPAAP